MVGRDCLPARLTLLVQRQSKRSPLRASARRLCLVLVLLAGLVHPQVAAAASTKLSGTMPAGWEVWSYASSSDGRYVVYRVDTTPNSIWHSSEIFSGPVAGGRPVKLNGTLAAGGDMASDPAISPDSSLVVYRADQASARAAGMSAPRHAGV